MWTNVRYVLVRKWYVPFCCIEFALPGISCSILHKYLTQTEYLEETGLRAEARGCASERSCSHPQDVGPCETVYIYIYISHATEERRASSCHCFQFLSFEVKTKNFLLWTARSFVFSSPTRRPLGG